MKLGRRKGVSLMFRNKKGAALLQVLLITVILAGMATMLLRASLSRSTAARNTRRTVSSQLLVNSCMAEVNTMWSLKSPQAFARDMNQCIMYCKSNDVSSNCTAANSVKSHTCEIELNGVEYEVIAEFTEDLPTGDGGTKCELTYTIQSDYDVL